MATSSKHVLFYLCFVTLWACFFLRDASGAQIGIHPEVFVEAVTEVVHISCCPDGTSARAKEILLMEIAKDGDTPITNIRQNSKISFGGGITNRFQAEGAIDQDVSQSYLNLTLLYPGSDDAGTYTCVMSYLDEAGLLKQDRATGNLAVNKQNSTTTEDRIVTLETALTNLLDRVKALEKENSRLQKDNSNQSKQIDVLTEKVAFTSTFSASVHEATPIANGQVIAFQDVLQQYGNAYNASTGIYTAPRAGLYAFHLVLEIGSGGTGEISLVAGKKKLARLYTQDKDYGDQSSVSSVIDLQPGVEVRAVVTSAAGSSPSVLGQRLCVFSGHLIKLF